MSFDELWNILKIEIPRRIGNNKGLNHFAENRSKFEGWLKVEICDILSEYMVNITPELEKIDIVADSWALELKTPTTNYSHLVVESKTMSITDDIDSIVKDIETLKENSREIGKAVIFIVFPLSLEENQEWKKHKDKISIQLQSLKEKEFTFENGVSAVLYVGLV